MASPYGTIKHRPYTTSPSTPMAETDEPKGLIRKTQNGIEILFPFTIPSNLEATAGRMIKNLSTFGLYYTYFLWLILFISLIPERKVSLVYLVVMREVTCLYLLFLRALPSTCFVHKIVDKRLVLVLLAIGTAVALILTDAAIHLLVTLAAGIPIILVHAIFKTTDDVAVDGEVTSDAVESMPLVNKNTGDIESSLV